jgi:hypothetical protein
VLTEIRRTSAPCEVGRAYLDHAVQHAIAVGTTTDHPPGGALLQIAELAGGAEWRDAALEIAVEAKRWVDALPPGQRSPTAIDASLRRSGAWMTEDIAESWFLDDAEVRALIRRTPRRSAAARLIAEVLPARRDEWAERFLLFALRARSATHQPHKAHTDDFAILAHCLCEGRDMATIPLMAAIAEHSVEVSRLSRW